MSCVLALLAAVALAGGCGSTAQQSAPGAPAAGPLGVTAELGGGVPPDGPGGPAAGSGELATGSLTGLEQPGSTVARRVGASAAGGAGVASGPAAGGVSAGGTGASRAVAGPQGPGVSATTIKIGIVAVEDPNAGNNSAGINTANVHNIDQTYKAVVDDLNKRGGIQGRRVQLVVHRFDNNTTNEQLQQQACEAFTRDDRVFASLSPLGENALTCFEKAGMASIGGGHTGYGQAQYRTYPHLLTPGAFSLEDQVANNIRGFKAQGWLSGWNPSTGTADGAEAAHVGLLAFDIPAYRNAVERHARPALAAAGVKRVDVFYIRPNLQDGQADAQSAVLQFKAAGVSHVTFLDNSGGLLELVFATNANSQGYFPRFGCDSGSCNQIVAEQMPASSLRGASLTGWSPLNDVPANKDFVLPGRVRCEKIMREADIPPYSRNDLNVMANVCEGVWFFEAAARRAGSRLTADTLMTAAFAAGQGFSSPATFATEVTPTRHAGAGAYRTAAWDVTCGGGTSGCFIYEGPVRRFGS